MRILQTFIAPLPAQCVLAVPLNAGVAAFTTPADEFIEVLAAKPGINGNRASFGTSYGPAWQSTLPAGDHVVRAGKGDRQSEAPLSVKPGERVQLALSLP